MKKIRQFFLTTLVLLSSALTSWAVSEPYSGTPSESLTKINGDYDTYGLTEEFDGYYVISSAEDLYCFADSVNGGKNSINAVLTDDIVVNLNVPADGNLNGSTMHNWTPIGTSSNNFKGTFDGNGHTISGLYFKNTTNSNYPDGGKYVGLIGYANGATIKNVGVIDSYIRGYQYVGGICGCSGVLTNCYNTGTVSSSSYFVGGICGSGGTQTNCYNTGTVSGSSYVGGICGYGGTQTNCYYLAGSAIAGGGGDSVTAEEIANGKATYLLNGSTSEGNLAWYQTIGTDALPVWDNTHGVVYATLPCPSFTNDVNSTHKDHLSNDVTGYCTACGQFIVQGALVTESNHSSLNLTADFVGYYAISSSGELYWFANEVNNGNTTINAVLTADIVVNENVLTAEGELNGTPTYSWTPIGTSSKKYAGTFDGNGHTISGLYFNNTTNKDYPNGGNSVGLIGRANGAKIKNVGVVDTYFKGYYYVSGICGYSTNTTISNCHNTGTVSGTNNVGGICGLDYDSNTNITNCHNTGTVSCSGTSYYVGGICGHGGTQTNCYNTGTVSGSYYYVGGICGGYGTQTNCYNIGKVSGYRLVGGICGGYGTQTNCYNTGTVSGFESVGGICGGYGTQTNCCYLAGCAKDGNNVVQYGVGNGTKGQTTADVAGKTMSATAEAFASGEVAYLLNGGTSEGNLAWYQTIGTDAVPVWDNTHGVVYKTLPCPSFSNDPNNTHKDHSSNDVTGHCSACGQFLDKATLVTESNHSGLNLTADFVGYYAISNSAELYWFANEVNNGNATINAVLTADIVVNENVLKADGTLNGTPTYSWTPIGTSSNSFKGTFDGNGHTISGLYFNNAASGNYPDGGNYVGLIGRVYRETKVIIKNVGLIDSYIRGYSNIGGICGLGGLYTEIINCYNTGTVSGSSDVGGICGYVQYGTQITNCYNKGTVSGSDRYVGGICSYTRDMVFINNCYNTGTVSGSSYVGGIFSYCGGDGNSAVERIINNCFNTGTVSGSFWIGGICGYGNKGRITNCYNTGTVSGSSYVGGICGENVIQTNCYYLEGCGSKNTFGVSATAEEFASGKIGYLLNKNNNNAWYQDLYSDEYPLLDDTHNLVSGYIEEVDDTYTVVGEMFLATNYEVAEGKTLNVPAGTSLTTTGNAVITNNGTLRANGTLSGNNLAGNGTFVTELISLCSISNLKESYVYKSTDYTLEDGLTNVAVSTVILGKTFTLDANATVSYSDNRNVGTATISWTNDADENDVLSGQFEITPKTITISNIKAENKVYDGNEATTVSYTADVFAGDDVTFGTAAAFDNKNAGNGKEVSFSYTKSGSEANNYAFATTTGTTTANIEQLELVISSTVAAGKVYDGNTTTTVAIAASNIVSGDEVIFGTAAAFDNKNVGTNKDVNFDFTKSGADAANYKFAAATGTVKAAITARSLTLSNFKADSKTYDATTNATGGQFSDNRVSGDVLEFSYNYSFADKNVENGKDVNFSSIAITGGADKNNYTLATTSGKATADITVKTFVISNIKAENKTYDGNTATTVSYDADVFNGDKVTFGTAATFDDKTARAGKTVSFDYTKSGADANNYVFATTTGTTTANIEQLELVISSTVAAGKVYDGNTTTTVAIAASNIVSGDVVTFGTAAAFDNKNVGTNKTVNFTYTKSGADAANYSFAQANGTATAAISARELTLSNFVAADKVYDGTTSASGSFSDDRVSGDELEFSYDVEFDDENANTDIDIYFSNIAISGGTDKDNYYLDVDESEPKANADITPVTDEVVVTITMPTRTVVYNGQGNHYTVSSESDVISCNSELYFRKGSFGPVDNDDFQTYMQNIQQKTDVNEYMLGWTAEMFENKSPNFSNVTFNVTDGKLIITPKTGVVVTVTENSRELVYNTEEQSVEGYTVSIDDELNIYAESDFTFSGTAVAAGKTVGTYPMELSTADFSNTNTNYADVEFVIVDGALIITQAPEAPNKPEATMQTLFVNTQHVELPENWKWAENKALELGDNVATANYDGADRGNYVIESVDVTITRNECAHDGGTSVLLAIAPTCTEQGYSGDDCCALCGQVYRQGHIMPALGHAFDTVAVAATCTTAGYKELTCSRCNHVEHIDPVSAAGHKADSVVIENITAATCTEAGSKDSVVYCSVCHVELSRNVIVIPAIGHKADSVAFENVVEATHTTVGTYDSVVYCSVCHVELTRTTVEVPQILAETIKLTSKPNKVDYKQGEALDVKGGKIAIGYSDKSTEEFEILAGWVSGFDSQKVGEQKLTVTFESVSSTLTTTFNVTVSKEDDNTAIDETAAEISIYAYNSTIVVEAADAIEGEIAVFDVNGRMVVKTLAAGSRTEIQMQREGLYIVRVGNQAKRVVIK